MNRQGQDKAVDTTPRLARLRERLGQEGLDALWVTGATNRRYLSGFTGSAGSLLITGDAALLITDGRYITQATAEAPAFTVVRHGTKMLDTLAQQVAELGVKGLGFEAEHQTVAFFHQAKAALDGVELVPTQGLVEGLRMVKDPEELALIRQAAQMADAAFNALLPDIRPGVSERDLALALEFDLKSRGAQDLSFPIIVVSGPRSALPHGRPTERVLQAGDLVTFDWGCVWGGYCSDVTRTVVIGEPTPRQREVYDTVLAAQLAGLAALRPGVTGREVDAAAREVIAAAGYGENFSHGLGHGLGMDVHEGPRLAAGFDQELQPGMVVTVEPGIYIPGWGGVRIEDLVVITETGYEILSTGVTKELLVL
ncbi:MAG TPA: Xaa-Pro peptidase family protein [Sphingobacteriaceae bacterium]|nr:Xaa-Pro peptidase family protein [Sphingobacteriaceae bacterium]